MEKTEILMKLISLANNNPNDHEANAAARKVCLMLAEMKVNFISKKTVTPRPNPFNDFRSEDMFDILRNMSREANRQYTAPPPFTREWSNPFTYSPPSYQKEPDKPKREKVTRECADCGGKHMTRCEGIFYCNKCQWRRYQENKAKQSHA